VGRASLAWVRRSLIKHVRRLVNNLEYFKDLISDLKDENNIVSITSSVPLLIKYSFKSYFKSKGRLITFLGARTTTLNLNLNIFNNKVILIEINYKVKDVSKYKEDSSLIITSK